MSETTRQEKRILVVDDTGIVRTVHRKLLTDIGYAVDEACDGKEALALLEKEKYEAVFMDINMPNMDGLTAASEIRRREENTRHIPIIGITGYENEEKACLDAGMDAVLLKPVTPAQMYSLVEEWINNNHSHS